MMQKEFAIKSSRYLKMEVEREREKLHWYGTVESIKDKGDIYIIISDRLFILKQDHKNFQNVKDLFEINKVVFVEHCFDDNIVIDINKAMIEFNAEIKSLYTDNNHNIIIKIDDNIVITEMDLLFNELILSYDHPIFDMIYGKLKIGNKFLIRANLRYQKLYILFLSEINEIN